MDSQIMARRVSEYMKAHHMAEAGDGILAAVSGGADSVCLLLILHALSEELGIHLAAFHLNHGLRGPEADRDEAYVRKLCENYDIPLKVVHENVRQYAKEHHLSEEEAGRDLRYQHLVQAAKEFGLSKIATAHHRDDHVETVLMNLFRGSGLKGLGGIRPVRGTIIRPLLNTTKQEIETYLNKKNVVWCEDSTNKEATYGRNRVRNLLIPWVEENINDQAAAHVMKTAEFASQADEYFTAQAEKILDECVGVRRMAEKKTGNQKLLPNDSEAAGETSAHIWVREFDAQPQIMKTYLVRAMIGRVAESGKNISSRHIEAICALTGPGGGTEVDLPYGLKALRGYEMLEIKRVKAEKTERKPGKIEEVRTVLSVRREESEGQKASVVRLMSQPQVLEYLGISVEIRTFSWKKGLEIPKKQCTKWFDYDKIKDALWIRTREPGDYIVIDGGKRKLLKRFFIDEKIPEALRSKMLLLADGHHILWIYGYRMSEEYKVTELTQNVLEVRIHKGEENG